MVKIRIPESRIADFKSFCTVFSKTLESQHGIRLRGNKLFNAVARAAGHDSYTALLIDAKTYGKGNLDWLTLPKLLSRPLSEFTGAPHSTCLVALNRSIPKNASVMIAGIDTTDRSSCEETPQPTIGELYAGRCRPPTFEMINGFLDRHVCIEARIAHLSSDRISFDELNFLSKEVHRRVPQEKGVRETDIAGWIIDNGSRLGIDCPRHIAATLRPSISIENLSVRDIDLAFRRSSLGMNSNNLFFHSRAHSTCVSLAHMLAVRKPSVSSPALAQQIMNVSNLNEVLALLPSGPHSGNYKEMLANIVRFHAETESLARQFSDRDDQQFQTTCGYIRLILTSESYRHSCVIDELNTTLQCTSHIR